MFGTSKWGCQAPAKSACICAQPTFDPSKVKVFRAKTGLIPGRIHAFAHILIAKPVPTFAEYAR
jgi:hypothetical protein